MDWFWEVYDDGQVMLRIFTLTVAEKALLEDNGFGVVKVELDKSIPPWMKRRPR